MILAAALDYYALRWGLHFSSPSLHATGMRYAWKDPEQQLAALHPLALGLLTHWREGPSIDI